MPLPTLPPIDTEDYARYRTTRLRRASSRELLERARAIPPPAYRGPPEPQPAPPVGQPTTVEPPPAAPALPAPTPGARPAGPPPEDLVPNQLAGGQELTTAQAMSACGPAAAVAFARHTGRNPTLREAVDLARSVGWTEAQGMAGPASQQRLLEKMGIPARLEAGVDWAKVRADVEGGNPVTISTPKHYFVATAYDPERDAFNFQASGEVLKGGGRWLKPTQVASLGNGLQGALYLDNPEPGTAPSVARDASMPAVAPAAAPAAPAAPVDLSNRDAFARTAGPYAKQIEAETGIPAEVMLGIAINEGALAKGTVASQYNNLFGIKATRDWQGATTPTMGAWEVVGGQNVTQPSTFRAYESPAESFRDFATFLQENPRYGEALKHTGDPNRFIGELKKAGYATDPAWPQKVLNIAGHLPDLGPAGWPAPTGEVGTGSPVSAPQPVGPAAVPRVYGSTGEVGTGSPVSAPQPVGPAAVPRVYGSPQEQLADLATRYGGGAPAGDFAAGAEAQLADLGRRYGLPQMAPGASRSVAAPLAPVPDYLGMAEAGLAETARRRAERAYVAPAPEPEPIYEPEPLPPEPTVEGIPLRDLESYDQPYRGPGPPPDWVTPPAPTPPAPPLPATTTVGRALGPLSPGEIAGAIGRATEGPRNVVGQVFEAARAITPTSIAARTVAGEEQIAAESRPAFAALEAAMQTYGPESPEALAAADAYNQAAAGARAEGVYAAAERNPSLLPAELTAGLAGSALAGVVAPSAGAGLARNIASLPFDPTQGLTNVIGPAFRGARGLFQGAEAAATAPSPAPAAQVVQPDFSQVARQVAPAAPPPPSPILQAPPPAVAAAPDIAGTIQPPGATSTARGISNPADVYEFRYRAVPLDELVVSHTPSFGENPAYPSELQPRIRDRAASRLQVEEIARRLEPDALLEDVGQLDRGPMIIGPDNVVESGNGRTMALRVARDEHPQRMGAYQAKLRQLAPSYGLDPAEVAAMENPVLVRERITPVDRARFAQEGNASAVLTMSPVETAAKDASRLPDQALANLAVGENQSIDQALASAANRPFVRAWMGTIPNNERAALITATQELNIQGRERLKEALFAKTYGGDAGGRLAATFFESIDPVVKNIEHGMFASLPGVARTQAMIRAGTRPAELAIADDVAQAVNVLARLKQNGIPIADYVGQEAMFGRELDPMQTRILEHLNEIARSPRLVRSFFESYADAVDRAADVRQGGMFGAAPPTKEALIDQAITASRTAEPAGGLFGEPLGALPTPPAAAAPAARAGLEAAPSPAPAGGLFPESVPAQPAGLFEAAPAPAAAGARLEEPAAALTTGRYIVERIPPTARSRGGRQWQIVDAWLPPERPLADRLIDYTDTQSEAAEFAARLNREQSAHTGERWSGGWWRPDPLAGPPGDAAALTRPAQAFAPDLTAAGLGGLAGAQAAQPGEGEEVDPGQRAMASLLGLSVGLFGRRGVASAARAIRAPRAGFAGNVKLSKYPEEVRAIIQRTFEENPEAFERVRRGVITDDEVRELARGAGVEAERVFKMWKPGDVANAETLLALREALGAQATRVLQAQRAARDAPWELRDSAVLELTAELTAHRALQEAVAGLTAEAGRALRQFRQPISGDVDDAARLKEFLQALAPGKQNGLPTRGAMNTDEMVQLLLGTDLSNADQVAKAAQEMYRPTGWDKARYIWVNSLLSGPPGRIRDVVSTSFSTATAPLETGAAALVDVPLTAGRRAVQRLRGQAPTAQRQVYFGEVPAEYRGMGDAAPQAMKDGWSTLTKGYTAAGDAVRSDIGSIAHREAFHIPFAPTRFVGATDAVYGTMNRRGAMAAIAYRTAAQEATAAGVDAATEAARRAYLEAHPTQAMIDEAAKIGRYRTFLEGGALSKSFSKMKNEHPWISAFVPFHNTAVALTKYALERSPIGFAMLGIQGARGKLTQRQVSEGIARATMGTAFWTTAYKLAEQQDITGAPPRDAKERDAFYRSGRQPYSIRLGDRWWNYQNANFAPVLASAVAARSAVERGNTSDALALGVTATMGIARAMIDLPFMKGVQDLNEVIDDPERMGPRYAEQWASSTVPQGIQFLARASDDIIRDPDNPIEAAMAGIPGVSRMVRPKINAFGDVVERPAEERGIGALNPLRTSEPIRDNPVERELAKLRMTDYASDPGFVTRKQTFAKQDIELSADERNQLQQTRGKLAYTVLAQIVTDPSWAQLEDKEKAAIIHGVYGKAHEQAKASLTESLVPRIVASANRQAMAQVA